MTYNKMEIRRKLADALPVRQIIVDGYVWMLSAQDHLMFAPLRSFDDEAVQLGDVDPWCMVDDIENGKTYWTINDRLEIIVTDNATQAMRWHRSGDDVTVSRPGGKSIIIPGAPQKPARDENRDYCRRVADELDSYVAGDARRCPNCGEALARDWYDVGDKFRCPCCHDVTDTDDWEQLGVYDYMEDVLDYDFRIDSQREFSGIRVFVTLGGPSCWIDTERRAVELRWGGESACYGLLSDTVDAVEEWGRELWEMGC